MHRQHILLMFGLTQLLTGCTDSGSGGVNIPEPTKQEVPKQYAEMHTIVNMNGASCPQVTGVWQKAPNVYTVKCAEMGSATTSTAVVVDLNSNSVQK